MEIDISKLLPGEEGILEVPNYYFEKGVAKGIEIGKEKGDIVVVMNMHKKGLSDEVIADFSGISLERVKEIINTFSKQ